MDLLVSKGDETTVETFVEKPMVDGVFNYVGSESSNITEALQVDETDHDELSIGDHSPLELWLESQSSNDTTLDMENKKRKGKYVIGEDTTMCEENSAYNDQEPSSPFDRRLVITLIYLCYIHIIKEKCWLIHVFVNLWLFNMETFCTLLLCMLQDKYIGRCEMW